MSLIEQAVLLIERLERISVDSAWARRSSGLRGALLHWMEDYRQSGRTDGLSKAEIDQLTQLIEAGYRFLVQAARAQFR